MTNKKPLFIVIGVLAVIAVVVIVTRVDKSPEASDEVATETAKELPKVDQSKVQKTRAKEQLAQLRANLQRDIANQQERNDKCPSGYKCITEWDCGEKATGGPYNCGGPMDRCCKEPTEKCPGKCEAFMCPRGAKKFPGAFADCKFPGNCCESSGNCPGECAIGICPEGTAKIDGAFDDCDLPHMCCAAS